MGMSIDKSIEILYERDKCMEYVTDNDSEAFETAIDTMRKYQKIKQILKDIPYGGDATVRRIQEVVEDGNDD